MSKEVGNLPPQELSRVLTHGLLIPVTPPRSDGGLEYVAALESALKRAYPRVSVTYVRGPQSDWVIFYHPTPASLFPEDERDELMAAARASHGLPAIGSAPGRTIPETKVAAVKAKLCSTDGQAQLHHRAEIGTDSVSGAPPHKVAQDVIHEPEETRVGLLVSIAASGNEVEVQIGASTKPVIVVGSSDQKKTIRSLLDQCTKLQNKKIGVKREGRHLTVSASEVVRALESEIARLLSKTSNDYKLSHSPSPDSGAVGTAGKLD